MTNNEAIYAVLDGTGLSTDDFPVSKRFVYNELKSARTELIKQELNKNMLFDSGSLQTIEVIKYERSEINKYGYFNLKSVLPVPKTIEYTNGIALYVYLLNGKRLSMVDQSSEITRLRARYPLAGFVGYYLRNEYLYITGYDDVDKLEGYAEGHFNDPEEVIALNAANNPSGCEEECMPVYDYPFTIPGHLLRRAVEIAKASALRKLQIPADASNNSQFDPNVKSTPQSTRQGYA